jgi:predicted HicB family RNase H-like nuclease
MGISRFVMPKQAPKQDSPKRGRPATGKTKVKLSASVSPALIAAAVVAAGAKGESLSQFVSRAMQNLILES